MPKISAQSDEYFIFLNAELEKEQAKGALSARFVRLGVLLALHADDKKTPNDGWKATLLAGRLGIPAPTWAIELLEEAEHDAITGKGKGESKRLDVLLGFKGQGKGGGKLSAVQKGLQATLHEYLCWSVRTLVASNVSVAAACRMVAKKLASNPKPSSEYSLRHPNAETLKKIYAKWQKERGEEVLSIYDKGLADIPPDIKEKFRDGFQS